jgi:hypothetical protein
MGVLQTSTVSLSILFIVGCSSGQSADPPPSAPAKTVFDPLTQSMDRARDVQKTVDQHAIETHNTIDADERGASTEHDASP